MYSKTFKKLRLLYIFCVAFAILVFIFDALYVTKNVEPVNHVALESWSIIITLAGIYISIKFLHPGSDYKQNQSSKDEYLKKYSGKFYARLGAMMGIFIFNIGCLHFTGVKNFIFQSAITIFALFFCAPDKNQTRNEL